MSPRALPTLGDFGLLLAENCLRTFGRDRLTFVQITPSSPDGARVVLDAVGIVDGVEVALLDGVALPDNVAPPRRRPRVDLRLLPAPPR